VGSATACPRCRQQSKRYDNHHHSNCIGRCRSAQPALSWTRPHRDVRRDGAYHHSTPPSSDMISKAEDASRSRIVRDLTTSDPGTRRTGWWTLASTYELHALLLDARSLCRAASSITAAAMNNAEAANRSEAPLRERRVIYVRPPSVHLGMNVAGICKRAGGGEGSGDRLFELIPVIFAGVPVAASKRHCVRPSRTRTSRRAPLWW